MRRQLRRWVHQLDRPDWLVVVQEGEGYWERDLIAQPHHQNDVVGTPVWLSSHRQVPRHRRVQSRGAWNHGPILASWLRVTNLRRSSNRLAPSLATTIFGQSASDNDVALSDTDQWPFYQRINNDKQEDKPSDPDPFSSTRLDKVHSSSRRGSLAPLSPDEVSDKRKKRSSSRSSPKGSPRSSRSGTPSSIMESKANSFFSDPFSHTKHPKPKPRAMPGKNQGTIPEKVLILIFQSSDIDIKYLFGPQ